MVERIVDAAHGVLAREGYAALSTNRVAAAAGVSPGSVYQYFPDMHAILDRLIERSWDRIADQVAAALAERLGDEGPGAIGGVVDALLTALEENADLLRVMTQDLPAAAHAERMHALERRVQDLVAALLVVRDTRRAPASASSDRAAAAWVVTTAVQSLAVRFVLEQPTALDRARFVAEMERLWSGYLGGAWSGA